MFTLNRFCAALATIAVCTGSVFAVPYASTIRVGSTTLNSGVGTNISYNLNETAGLVNIELVNIDTATTAATFAGTTLAGPNTVVWNGKADNGVGANVVAGNYRVVITAEKTNTAWAEIASQRSLAAVTPDNAVYTQVYSGFSPNDFLYIRDTTSDRFGESYGYSSYGGTPNPTIAAVQFRPDLFVTDGTTGYDSRFLRLTGIDGTSGSFSPYVWSGSLDPDNTNIVFYAGQTEPTFWYGDLNSSATLQNADPSNHLGGALPRAAVVVKEGSDKYAYFCSGYTLTKAPMTGNVLSGPPVTVADFTATTNYARQVRLDSEGNVYFLSRATGTGTAITAGFNGLMYRWNKAKTLGATPSLTAANADWTVITDGTQQFMTGPAISPVDGNVYVGFANGSATAPAPANGVYLVGNTSSAQLTKTLTAADKVIDTAALGWGASNVYFQLRCDPAGNILLIDRLREQLRLYTPGGASEIAIPAPTSQNLTITPVANVAGWDLY